MDIVQKDCMKRAQNQGQPAKSNYFFWLSLKNDAQRMIQSRTEIERERED